MFFLPIDLLTMMLLVLFAANAIQYLAKLLSFEHPNEVFLVSASTAVGFALFTSLNRQFEEAYVTFEKITVSALGQQYWLLICLVAVCAAGIIFAIKKIPVFASAY